MIFSYNLHIRPRDSAEPNYQEKSKKWNEQFRLQQKLILHFVKENEQLTYCLKWYRAIKIHKI